MVDFQRFAHFVFYKVSLAPNLAPNLLFIKSDKRIFEMELNLQPLKDFEKHKPFKEARLYDAKGDLKKRWYINFHVWDEQKNRLVRKRDYSINKYATTTERRAYAKRQIRLINKLLEDGHYIRIATPDEEEETNGELKPLKEAFDYILELKKNEVRHKSYLKIRQAIDGFMGYINTDDKPYPDSIQKKDIIAYSDYLITKGNKTASTRNSHIFWLRHIFSLMEERELIKENPAKGIGKMKEAPSTKNKAFVGQQIRDILELADEELSLAIKFFYYCFMRRNEIRLIQLRHINLKDRRMHIPANTAKSGKASYIVIPQPLLRELEKLHLEKYPPDYFLFGKHGTADRVVIPSKEPYSVNLMYQRHRAVLKKLDLENKDYTLYSWKHTGVVAAYKAGIDIKNIQLQCRHYSLEMTDNYLKSLGLFRDDDVFSLMPEL